MDAPLPDDDGEADSGQAGAPIPDDDKVSRKQAFLFILPFLLLGLADVVLLLGWGLDPLWGFMILPPILAISFIGWIAFKYGFVSDNKNYDYAEDDEPKNAVEDA
ncbi:hypothetical protein [Haloarchaeobius sp. TZWSO28]|uniref:hypothetical protein n=1 Tax=Haloarchaeobius sp. TZWSO28 TaxID=3446119 RepID=UPI003EBB15DF